MIKKIQEHAMKYTVNNSNWKDAMQLTLRGQNT